MRFRNRRDAGQQLVRHLRRLAKQRPVVVGLPRGGVPVAHEVARALGAPLDVLVVRKLGCPWQPELGLGAIGEQGTRLLNAELVRRTGVSPEEIEAVARREGEELERRVRRYRGGRAPLDVEGRVVVVVDDGLATGFTARAAIEVMRARGARRVVLAVPVAPADSVAELQETADEVVCVQVPRQFYAIGQFYDDFTQTSDEEVARLLADSRAGEGAGGRGGARR